MELTGVATAVEPLAKSHKDEDQGGHLRRVFLETSEALYRFILVRVGGDRDVADDLLQQTCCVASGHRKLPAAHAECEAWLRGIAKNLIRRHWRHTKTRGRCVDLQDPAVALRLVDSMEVRPLPVEALIAAESTTLLMLAITALSAADPPLVFAYYFDGRDHNDIASDLGVTPKSVETKLYRIRSRLRALLRDPERTVFT